MVSVLKSRVGGAAANRITNNKGLIATIARRMISIKISGMLPFISSVPTDTERMGVSHSENPNSIIIPSIEERNTITRDSLAKLIIICCWLYLQVF